MFLVGFCFNFIVLLLGSFTYGTSLHETITESIQTFWIQQVVSSMVMVHCLLTVTLMVNPFNQQAEEWFNVPHSKLFFKFFSTNFYKKSLDLFRFWY